MGFASVLTIVFITLKLCDVIDWSWFWVLSPIWIRSIIVIAITRYIEHSESDLQRSLNDYYKALRK